jgi:predicted DNA-binding transcriptional regulator YafY
MVIDDTTHALEFRKYELPPFALTPEEQAALERGDRGYAREGDDELLRAALHRARRTLALRLAPGEPQADAPTDIALLPDYWDERRRRQGKVDTSRCAAELRIALAANLQGQEQRP